MRKPLNFPAARIPLFLFYLLIPKTGSACVRCVFAMADYWLPPVLFWAIVPVAWFLATSVIRSISGFPFTASVCFPCALLIAVLLLLLDGAILGPFATLLLFFPACRSFISACRPDPEGKWNQKVRHAVRLLGILFSLVLLCGVVYGLYKKSTRTPADFICRWPETTPARSQFNKLVREESESLADYRDILRRGAGNIDFEVAQRVALIGDPAIDLPLLQEARKRIGSKKGSSSVWVRRIDEAIAILKQRGR